MTAGQKRKGRPEAAFARFEAGCLALRELLATARLVEADLLSLDLARIPRHQASLRQRRLQLIVIVDQRARYAVAHGAGLARLPAADHVDHHVERLFVVRENQRLAHNHPARLAREELVDGLLVDDDIPRALFDEDACDRRLAATRAVVIITDHRGLNRMVMKRAGGMGSTDLQRLRLLR